MKISILGLGWFGLPFGESLKHSHEIYGTTRSSEKKKQLSDNGLNVSVLSYPQPPNEVILDSEIIILNIPPFEGELEWFKSWNLDRNIWMIFISSTSKKEILLKQEEWVQAHFNTWTILRFGGLVGGNRRPGKYLAGKKNLPGRFWPVKLLDRDDAISFTRKVIDEKIQYQILDVYEKTDLTREEFYIKFCQENGLEIPEFDQSDNSVSRS